MMRRLVVALAILIMAAGCSSIPQRSDPVILGTPPAAGAADQGTGIQPGGPDVDASPDAIVRGFIRALTANDTSYSVAREFLVPDARKSWTPSDDVTVIDQSVAATPGPAEGEVRLQANRVAKVDATGEFSLDSGSLDYQFELAQIDEQWRIVNPPTDLIIDSTSFNTLYRVANIYFADPSGTRLVPDVRYFRTNLQQRANLLIQSLIDGPSALLAPGVRNELADPVSLRSAVTYNADLITVDLTGLANKSEPELRTLSAQIWWTLKDLGTSSVRITDDGDPIIITGVAETQTEAAWEDFSPNNFPFDAVAYYLDDGALLMQGGVKIGGPVGTGQYNVSDAAVSLDGQSVATVGTSASGAPELRTGGLAQQLTLVDLPDTTSIGSPTWGPSSDEFWVVRNASEILRVTNKGAPRAVNVATLAGIGPIRQIARSRDGARVAIVAGAAGQPGRLYVATIQVTADAVRVGQPKQLSKDLDVVDLAWRDASTIAVLASSSAGAGIRPFTMIVDDSGRQALPTPVLSGAVATLAAAPGRLFLCSINHTILQLSEDSAWVSITPGIVVTGDSPFYPG